MPAPHRPTALAAALVGIGTTTFLVSIIVFVTGGFSLTLGPLRISSHGLTTPVLLTVAAWGLAAARARANARAAAAAIAALIERHATAAALVLAAAAGGIGVSYGTYAAAGSDASGYVSQADLLASAQVVRDEPLARVVGWPNATTTLAPLGYRAGLSAGEVVPTYPPGLPLLMAAAQSAAGDFAVFLVVPLLGALSVLWTYLLGQALHSRLAGLVAAALLATSPIFLFQIVQPMSDVAAAAMWTLALLLARGTSRAAAVAAGVTAGAAIVIRPNLAVLAIPVALAAAGWPRSHGERFRIRDAFTVLGAVAPFVAVLLLVQWRLYGSPLASGYGPTADLFSAGNVATNAWRYGQRLLTGETAALCLGLVALAVHGWTNRGWTNRAAPAAPLRTAASLAGAMALVTAASYLPYGTFSEWLYLRFLLPALPIAFVLAGAIVANAATAVPAAARGVLLLAALAAACSANVNIARREQAFDLWRYESRYRTAGRYLEAALPPHAVVFAVQESGSVRHYARVPVARWDLLASDLDTALDTLAGLGRRPLLVVEDWEEPDLRARFPRSAVARLDWPARAEFGSVTRVRVFDPADRAAPRSVATDRLP